MAVQQYNGNPRILVNMETHDDPDVRLVVFEL